MKPAHILFLMLLLAAAIPAAAQKGLAVGALFDGRYRDIPDARETIISGGQLKKHKLSTYRSITLTDAANESADAIERAVRRDGADALSREVQFRDGRLFYGFYRLRRHNDLNRYIFFLNQLAAGGNKVILIYLEGSASPEQVKKMLKQ